jgi:hypothetical protein
LSEHGELWEDIYDALIAQSRQAEPRELIETVRQKLTEEGKFGGS